MLFLLNLESVPLLCAVGRHLRHHREKNAGGPPLTTLHFLVQVQGAQLNQEFRSQLQRCMATHDASLGPTRAACSTQFRVKKNRTFPEHVLKSIRDSSVGIATLYGLEGLGIESQWGEIFRNRPDRPWGPPSLLYNGYRISFLGVKRPGRGVDHPPYLAPRLKKE